MNPVLFATVQALLFLVIAPLITTYIQRVKAFFQSRRGPPILQGYYDLIKLMRKDSVVSEHSSWVFAVTPYIGLSAFLTACLMVPFVTAMAPLSFVGDFLVLIYLFAIVRFFTALAGLDAGSSFGGLGSSREMTISALIEPAMVLSLSTVALEAGSVNLTTIVQTLSYRGYDAITSSHILALASFFIVLIAETGRLPVDNPATHLELTMVHEAMVLENSGRNLAFVELGASIKQMILFTVIANIFLPFGMSPGLDTASLMVSFAVLMVKVFSIGLVVAVIETSTAKYRLFKVPDLLSVSFVLSFLALISHFMMGGA